MSLINKFIFFIKIFALVALVTGCLEQEQDFNNAQHTQHINSVEELNDFVLSQTYSVTLENGQTVTFTPSEFKMHSEGMNFTTAEPGFNFTDLTSSLSLQNGGNASLKIDNGDEYYFPYTLCFKISDLRSKYPDLLPEEYDDFYYYLAVGVGTYSEREVIEGEPIFVEDFLYILQHPEKYSSFYFKGFYSKEGYHFRLESHGGFSFTENSYKASGSAYETSVDYYYGEYILELSCY